MTETVDSWKVSWWLLKAERWLESFLKTPRGWNMTEAGLNILVYIQVSLQTSGSFLKICWGWFEYFGIYSGFTSDFGSFLKVSKGYKFAEAGLNILAYIQVSLQTPGSFLKIGWGWFEYFGLYSGFTSDIWKFLEGLLRPVEAGTWLRLLEYTAQTHLEHVHLGMEYSEKL